MTRMLATALAPRALGLRNDIGGARLALTSAAFSARGVVVGAMIAIVSTGCNAQGKDSEKAAADTLVGLTPLIEKDMGELRGALPDGAKALATKLPDDAGDLLGTQKAIKQTRNGNDVLSASKGSFFVFVNSDGVVVRSESDPDRLVDKNVFASFPDLKKALDPKATVVESFGEMEEMRGVKKGPDTTWVLASPVVDKDGKVRGEFVSGWAYRTYANYLEQQAKRSLVDNAKKANTDKVPIGYVFIVKSKTAYGSPDTPDVNGDALVALDLPSKTANGVYHGQVDITGRTFGVAAERAKGLGDDAVLAVLASTY